MPLLKFQALMLMFIFGFLFIKNTWMLFRFMWFSFLWQSLTVTTIWYYDIFWLVSIFSTVEYLYSKINKKEE